MRVKRQLLKYGPAITATIAGFLIAAAFCALGLTRIARNSLEEKQLVMAAPLTTKSKIVVVKIGDPNLKAWQSPTPFWTGPMATVLSQIEKCQPKAVGIDIILATDVDQYLEDVQIPSTGSIDRLRRTIFQQLDHLVIGRRMPHQGDDPVDSRWIRQISIPAEDQGREAMLDIVLVDGVVHSIPKSFDQIPSLSYALATMSDPAGIQVGHSSTADEVLLDYRYRTFTEINSAALLTPTIRPEVEEKLRDAIVLIGSAQFDRINVLGSQEVDGVYIHATAIASLLSDHHLTHCSDAWIYAAMLLGLAVTWNFAAGRAVLGIAALGVLTFGASQVTLERCALLLPVGPMVLGLISAAIATYATKFVVETGRRRYVERVFGMHVSPQVRDVLLREPENLNLGGQDCNATILFVDVRDSVRLGYTRSPEKVLDALNQLFAAIVPAVHQHSGVLSRFTGDGFLAVFGAPMPFDNHADQAVDAACQIVTAVAKLNIDSKSEDWKIGCGINTGTLIFGNLGTNDRSEFTVIGDVVNVAARIEKKTKGIEPPILISQETYQCLKDRDGVTKFGEIEIHGRDGALTTLYQVNDRLRGANK